MKPARGLGKAARPKRNGPQTGRIAGRRPCRWMDHPRLYAAAGARARGHGPSAPDETNALSSRRSLGARKARRKKGGRPAPLGINMEGPSSPQVGDSRTRSSIAGPRPMEKGPGGPSRTKKGGAAGDPPRRPRARARRKRVERRPPVSGALLSHGLTPQYHRRSAA